MKPRVLVAMSGGVDSSVAAALLAEQGYDVVGVTLHLWDARGASQVGRCCAPEDRDDARRTCEHLGVPHYVMDEREAFQRHVVAPFVADNLAGVTPSPCVACNQHVKLTRLWQIAQGLGAQAVATGHYVRVRSDGEGEARLLRGLDTTKDQSYFLYGVPKRLLARLMCPLGELTKDAARAEAKRLGLSNWNKPDSQELCFVPDGDVRGFIGREAGGSAGPGPVIDEAGKVLGQHAGIEGFTVGQRRGLGIAGPAPRYVLEVLPESRAVRVGPAHALLKPTLSAHTASWIAARPAAPFSASVRIRYRHTPAPATVTPIDGDRFQVCFEAPQRAIAPGQAAVVYAQDQVLGGGVIEG
ncbi:MAG: tRNA 2-thiouridine(34) synthase MnmA [Myxococcales bacterium]|nr:tRNA 2-thiouridine(34) synthase MnmA [Myxococcales bacterium]MDD9968805.1 tRNA 2-thiouridine(34) synthase MnmA [Myxococcales bacterium]